MVVLLDSELQGGFFFSSFLIHFVIEKWLRNSWKSGSPFLRPSLRGCLFEAWGGGGCG